MRVGFFSESLTGVNISLTNLKVDVGAKREGPLMHNCGVSGGRMMVLNEGLV